MNPPKRRVVTRSPKRTVGLFNCRWFQPQPIEHESRLEKHFLLRAILFPGLASVQHQPFKLELSGRGQSYTPDFLLRFTSGEHAVVEVKRSEKIKPLIARLDEVAQRLNERHLKFFVVHQGQIEGGLRAQRAALLRRYANLPVSIALRIAVNEALVAKPSGMHIGELRQRLNLSPSEFYALAARRELALSPDLLLSEDDLVFPLTKEVRDAPNQFGNWFGCAAWRTHT